MCAYQNTDYHHRPCDDEVSGVPYSYEVLVAMYTGPSSLGFRISYIQGRSTSSVKICRTSVEKRAHDVPGWLRFAAIVYITSCLPNDEARKLTTQMQDEGLVLHLLHPCCFDLISEGRARKFGSESLVVYE